MLNYKITNFIRKNHKIVMNIVMKRVWNRNFIFICTSTYEWKSSNSALATEIGTTGHWRKICICSCTNTVHKWTLHESFGKTPRENVRQLTPIKGKISISIEWRSISRYVKSCIFAISYLSVLCNSRLELNS